MKKEVDAAQSLCESCEQEVPPQLLKALEKDGRSLARGYDAAKDLSQNALRGLKDQRDSLKVNMICYCHLACFCNCNTKDLSVVKSAYISALMLKKMFQKHMLCLELCSH